MDLLSPSKRANLNNAMEARTLKITESDGNIVIKKKSSTYHIIFFVLLLLILVIILANFSNKISNNLTKTYVFVLAFIIILVPQLANFMHIFVGKIILDINNKEIHIHNVLKNQKSFYEISDIQVYFRKRYKKMDVSRVVFLLKDGSKLSMRTGSKEQAEELEELLKSYIHVEIENEDNEDE